MDTREQENKKYKKQKQINSKNTKNTKYQNIAKQKENNNNNKLKMSVFEGFTHPYTLPSKGEIDPQFLEVNYIHNSSSMYSSTTWTTQFQHISWEFVDKFIELQFDDNPSGGTYKQKQGWKPPRRTMKTTEQVTTNEPGWQPPRRTT